jgi:hypothetical protein
MSTYLRPDQRSRRPEDGLPLLAVGTFLASGTKPPASGSTAAITWVPPSGTISYDFDFGREMEPGQYLL